MIYTKVNQIKNLETVEYSCLDCLERIDVNDKENGLAPFADGVEVYICRKCKRIRDQESAEIEEEAARDAAEDEYLQLSMSQEYGDRFDEEEEYEGYYY
jgi:DNA-directed RNA polymerase subunit RPC12/RpoP